MTFRRRILLALLGLGVAPALVVGWTAFELHRRELLRTVAAAQTEAAEDLARQCETFVLNGVEHLKASTSYLPLAQLEPREVRDVLRVPLRQLPAVDALALVARDGRPVGEPVYEVAAGGAPPDLDAFARGVPLATALAADAAVGPAYRPRSGPPRVAVAARVEGPPVRVLAAELSLREIVARLDELARAGSAAFVLDAQAQPIAHGGDDAAPSPDELELARTAAAAARPASRSVVRHGHERWLAAWAPVGTLGWGVLLARPEEVVLSGVRRARAFTLFWAACALLAAVLIGTALARGVADPVARLSRAAAAVTQGRHEEPLALARRDELGAFAAAFDHMAAEVRRRDEEIRGWNAELSRRVEEKTAELKAAQEQIARARRLAALGSLGAGLAHEINNPMTSVVGLVSIVRREIGPETRNGELLGTVLEQAGRITRMIHDLRQLAEEQRAGPGVRFALATPVQAAIEGLAREIERAGVTLRSDLDGEVPPVQGDPVQIQQLVGHLLTNALAATPEHGEIRVSVAAVDGDAVKLTVSDNGRGIPQRLRERIFDPFFTTKERGKGTGLGLAVSNCIVESHHGKLLVDSEEGKGSTFTVIMPAAAAQAHLQ